MIEREHGTGRSADTERDEAPAAAPALPEAPADSDLYSWQMLLGEGVQADFDEALAELAK